MMYNIIRYCLFLDLYAIVNDAFPDINCFTFPAPNSDPRFLDNISPEFLHKGELFKKHIYATSEPKSVCGNNITGIRKYTYS